MGYIISILFVPALTEIVQAETICNEIQSETSGVYDNLLAFDRIITIDEGVTKGLKGTTILIHTEFELLFRSWIAGEIRGVNEEKFVVVAVKRVKEEVEVIVIGYVPLLD